MFIARFIDPANKWVLLLCFKASASYQLSFFVHKHAEYRYGAGLTNVEYAHICELMGRSVFAAEVSDLWSHGIDILMTNLILDLSDLQLSSTGHGKHGGTDQVWNRRAKWVNRSNISLQFTVQRPISEEKWLRPMLDGKIKSCFAMTEPDVASSDASNIQVLEVFYFISILWSSPILCPSYVCTLLEWLLRESCQ